MKESTVVFLMALVRALTCITSLVVAGYLAANRLPGWGWFLFVALCLGSYSIKFKGDK